MEPRGEAIAAVEEAAGEEVLTEEAGMIEADMEEIEAGIEEDTEVLKVAVVAEVDTVAEEEEEEEAVATTTTKVLAIEGAMRMTGEVRHGMEATVEGEEEEMTEEARWRSLRRPHQRKLLHGPN